jgi:hypothetical protein
MAASGRRSRSREWRCSNSCRATGPGGAPREIVAGRTFYIDDYPCHSSTRLRGMILRRRRSPRPPRARPGSYHPRRLRPAARGAGADIRGGRSRRCLRRALPTPRPDRPRRPSVHCPPMPTT